MTPEDREPDAPDMPHADTHTPLHGPTGGVPSDKALSDTLLILTYLLLLHVGSSEGPRHLHDVHSFLSFIHLIPRDGSRLLRVARRPVGEGVATLTYGEEHKNITHASGELRPRAKSSTKSSRYALSLGLPVS
eukprot:scaffold10789_cov141-Isochrysis_galbana.AAC.9